MEVSTPSKSLSHCPIPYSAGQWDKPPKCGTSSGTGNGAISLKALAANVLRSVPLGTDGGTGHGTGSKYVGQTADFSEVLVPCPKAPVLPQPLPGASPLEALARFERDPCGVVAWLAGQEKGQREHLVQRWASAIRAEARQRIAEASE